MFRWRVMGRRTVAGLITFAVAVLAVLVFFTLRGWPGSTPQLDGLTPMRGDLNCGTLYNDYNTTPTGVSSPAEVVKAEQCFSTAAAQCRAASLEVDEFYVDYGTTELVEVQPGAHCSIDYRWTGVGEPLPDTGTYQYGKCATAAYTVAAGLTLTGCDSGYVALSSLLPATPSP
jgi:hypothetical protein